MMMMMMFFVKSLFEIAFLCVFLILPKAALLTHGMRINEIADKGSDGVCEGEDWIELYNDSPNAVQLDGYVLHDDQYPENAEEKLRLQLGRFLLETRTTFCAAMAMASPIRSLKLAKVIR